jgi:hypothetical protein
MINWRADGASTELKIHKIQDNSKFIAITQQRMIMNKRNNITIPLYDVMSE